MADDLATQLAHAITKAAILAAGLHSVTPMDYVRAELATDLRRILSAEIPAWYAGYEAGCREQDAIHRANGPDVYSAPEFVPDERHRHTIAGETWEHAHEGGHEAHSAVSHDLSTADRIEPKLDACGGCGHSRGNHVHGPNADECMCRGCAYFRDLAAPSPKSGDVLERSTCRHCAVPVVLLHVEGGTPLWNHSHANRCYAPSGGT